ncbi:MAG: hypothetical protein Q9179_007709, partial [Wetmoreana sp. 5 TL-2023]
MGTRAWTVLKYRKRYYRFYHAMDGGLEDLGVETVGEIPQTPRGFTKWFREQLKAAKALDAEVECLLSVPLAEFRNFVIQYNEDTQSDLPSGIDTVVLPDFEFPFPDWDIEWVYLMDLDRQTLTINNGAHVNLLHVSKVISDGYRWESLYHDLKNGIAVILPSFAPAEAIGNTDLPICYHSSLPSLSDPQPHLEVVEAKGLNAFPLKQRHGHIVRWQIFRYLQKSYSEHLSAALDFLGPQDLHFREFAYLVLSVISPNFRMSFEALKNVVYNEDRGYAGLCKEGEEPEFLAYMGVGAHIEEVPPGSAPRTGMYWFDGTLVSLTTNLIETADLEVARVIGHSRKTRPTESINVILFSIEHVVLMRIYSDQRVQRTKVLPVFHIPNHTSRDARKRYVPDYLKKMERSQTLRLKELVVDRLVGERKVEKGSLAEVELQSELTASYEELDTTEESFSLVNWQPDTTKATFFAMAHVFESSACETMPPRSEQGKLPAP